MKHTYTSVNYFEDTGEGRSGTNTFGLHRWKMSVNNSPPTDGFHNLSSYVPPCFDTIIGRYIYIALTVINIIVLSPLSISVLCLGFQRWKRQRSVSSTAAMSHSDFVTYNMAIMELIGVSGYFISICGSYARFPVMIWVGLLIGAFPWFGQMSFPILTCVERYLAVVQPITYLRLRQVGGVRIRNISTGLIWLLCFTGVGYLFLIINYPEVASILSAALMAFFLIAVTFCSLSILCILIRPRPGEAAGNRVRVDQSKRKAFNTIIMITGVLLLRFGGNLVCSVVGSSPTVSSSVKCLMKGATGLFTLPSSLVLPLLFLHRAWKLPGSKHNTESG